jgi:hypothetical protein
MQCLENPNHPNQRNNLHLLIKSNVMNEIKDERDYAIRKGKVLERFNEEFHWRYKYNPLYEKVREMLIRDADPYELLEQVIAINDEIARKMQEMAEYVSPNYYLHQNSKP